jgi:3-phosphoglycerate kinase
MIRFVDSVNLSGKKVLVRVDFNVPIDDKGNIVDDYRIKKSLPTINYVLAQNPKQLILMSHFGRPKGIRSRKFSLSKVSKCLSDLLNLSVHKTSSCIVKKSDFPKNRLVLLENLRFHKGEMGNSVSFARKLSSYADIYVNDAFGTAHRSHASNNAITNFLPSYAGLLFKDELEKLNFSNPKRPLIAILGCAKLSDKIDLIRYLLKKFDKLVLGGLVVFTFLNAQGFNVGLTKVESSKLQVAKNLLKKYRSKIVLPVDVVVAKTLNGKSSIVDIHRIPSNSYCFDVGPVSSNNFISLLNHSNTVFWNGPLGYYEVKRFAKSTLKIAKFLSTKKGVKVIIGGGDTANAVKRFEKKFYHISTGGGASIQFVSGKFLPAIKALNLSKK